MAKTAILRKRNPQRSGTFLRDAALERDVAKTFRAAGAALRGGNVVRASRLLGKASQLHRLLLSEEELRDVDA